MPSISAPVIVAHGRTTVDSSLASSAQAVVDLGGRGLPVGNPIVVLDDGVGHRVWSKCLVATAQRGDAMQHEHEVRHQPFDVVLKAGRRQVELVGAHGGDDRQSGLNGSGEQRPGVGGLVGTGLCGRHRFGGHTSIMRPETGHVLSCLCENIWTCVPTVSWPSC